MFGKSQSKREHIESRHLNRSHLAPAAAAALLKMNRRNVDSRGWSSDAIDEDIRFYLQNERAPAIVNHHRSMVRPSHHVFRPVVHKPVAPAVTEETLTDVVEDMFAENEAELMVNAHSHIISFRSYLITGKPNDYIQALRNSNFPVKPALRDGYFGLDAFLGHGNWAFEPIISMSDISTEVNINRVTVMYLSVLNRAADAVKNNKVLDGNQFKRLVKAYVERTLDMAKLKLIPLVL